MQVLRPQIHEKKMQNRNLVRLFWLGYYTPCTHLRYPTTARRGRFDLPPCGSGPNPVSLVNLNMSDFSIMLMLTPGLVRTLIQRVTKHSRTPILKSSTISDLPVAWITGPATDPSRSNVPKLGFKNLVHEFDSFQAFSSHEKCREQTQNGVRRLKSLEINVRSLQIQERHAAPSIIEFEQQVLACVALLSDTDRETKRKPI